MAGRPQNWTFSYLLGTVLLFDGLSTLHGKEKSNDDCWIDDAPGLRPVPKRQSEWRAPSRGILSRGDGRLQLLRATSESRPSYPLYLATIATKDAIRPSYRMAPSSGFVADLLGLSVFPMSDALVELKHRGLLQAEDGPSDSDLLKLDVLMKLKIDPIRTSGLFFQSHRPSNRRALVRV